MRIPPHNLEAERALLGAILFNNNAFDRVSDYLRADHFSDPVNARVYNAIVKLLEQGHQANPVSLKTYLEQDELLVAAGGTNYVSTLAKSMVTVINSSDYGRLIHDLSLRRELIGLGEEMVNRAFDAHLDETAMEQIEVAIGRLVDMTGETVGSDGPVSVGVAVQRALRRHEAVDRGEIAGLSTGLQSLDSVMGLLEPGDLVVLAARPSMGKTALLLTVSEHVARYCVAEAQREGRKQRRQVVLFSLEMTCDDNADRVIAAATGIASPRRRRCALTLEHWDKLVRFSGEISGLPLLIDQRPRATLSRIRSVCRQLQRRGGLCLVGIDYLQIMAAERDRRFANRTAEIGYFVTGLKDLAKELGCPIIVLSQLNRGVEGRDDKRPILADLRESGEIEQAADVVGFCYRDQYYLERAEPKQHPGESDDQWRRRHAEWQRQLLDASGKAEIIIAKARNGETGTAHLQFDGPKTKFTDCA